MRNQLAFTIKENKYLRNETIPVIEFIDKGYFHSIEEVNGKLKISLSRNHLITSIDELMDLHKNKKTFYLKHRKLKDIMENVYLCDYRFTSEIVDLFFDKLIEFELPVK